MKSNKPIFILSDIAKFVNRFLNTLGISIVRTERKAFWPSPAITVTVGRYPVSIPSSSPLAACYIYTPEYSSHLLRLTQLLSEKYPDLSAIDVGANVGDTVCLLKTAKDIPVLCIEGDKNILNYLYRNIKHFENVEVHQKFLGEKTSAISACIDKVGWNATILPGSSETSTTIDLISLDDFMLSRSDFQKFKILKIDTEGFDCSIIRGASTFLKRVSPVVSFEYNRENMDAIGEPGLETLFWLSQIGYSLAAFHDSSGRYLFTLNLTDKETISDLHNYADGRNGAIYYYDITVFPESERNLASTYIEGERLNRQRISAP